MQRWACKTLNLLDWERTFPRKSLRFVRCRGTTRYTVLGPLTQWGYPGPTQKSSRTYLTHGGENSRDEIETSTKTSSDETNSSIRKFPNPLRLSLSVCLVLGWLSSYSSKGFVFKAWSCREKGTLGTSPTSSTSPGGRHVHGGIPKNLGFLTGSMVHQLR